MSGEASVKAPKKTCGKLGVETVGRLQPEGERKCAFFRVCIVYREPTFEHRQSGGARPYRGVFIVQACTRAAAVARAKDHFERIAVQSGVFWIRPIVGVQIEEVAGATAEQLDGAAQ